jgi:hypothetical protein
MLQRPKLEASIEVSRKTMSTGWYLEALRLPFHVIKQQTADLDGLLASTCLVIFKWSLRQILSLLNQALPRVANFGIGPTRHGCLNLA